MEPQIFYAGTEGEVEMAYFYSNYVADGAL